MIMICTNDVYVEGFGSTAAFPYLLDKDDHPSHHCLGRSLTNMILVGGLEHFFYIWFDISWESSC